MFEVVPLPAFKENYMWTLRGPHHAVLLSELCVSFSVLDIPGHARAHVAYYGAGALFCGDTLFACGCGKLFEGTAEQRYASL